MTKIKVKPFGLSGEEFQDIILSVQKERFKERRTENPNADTTEQLQDLVETFAEGLGQAVLENNIRLTKEVSNLVADLQLQILALSKK